MMEKVVIRDDQVVELALDVVLPGDNDREDFEEGGLVELALSIMECGLAQPITVRPWGDGMFRIVAGERRWRAHRIYTERVQQGKWRPSAKCRPGFVRALVRNLSDEEASKIMLAENDQRQDLKPLERAKAYQKRIDQFGWSVEQLAEAVKKGVRTVRMYLDLLQLEPYVQKAANDGDLPLGHAQLMAPLDANRQRMAMRLLAKGERVTYEMFREYVGQLLEEQGADKGKDVFPEMELQPFEHYDYMMLVFRSTFDWSKALDLFGLDKAGFTVSRGKRKIGLCRVVDGRKVLEKCGLSFQAESE